MTASKAYRSRSKKMTVAAPQKEKVRLAIECTPEERKYIKMFAAHQEKTLNEFVLDCVWAKIAKCKKSHIPNEETAAALDASERGEGHHSFKSVDEMFKFLGI